MANFRVAAGFGLCILPALLQGQSPDPAGQLKERVKAERERLKQTSFVTSYTLTVVQENSGGGAASSALVTTRTNTGVEGRINTGAVSAASVKHEVAAFAPEARYHRSTLWDSSFGSQYGFDGTSSRFGTWAANGKLRVEGTVQEGKGAAPVMLPVQMFFRVPEGPGEVQLDAVDTSQTITSISGEDVAQASFEMADAPAPLELITFSNGAMTTRYEFSKHVSFEGFRLPTEVTVTQVTGPESVVRLEYSGIKYEQKSAGEVREMARFPVSEKAAE